MTNNIDKRDGIAFVDTQILLANSSCVSRKENAGIQYANDSAIPSLIENAVISSSSIYFSRQIYSALLNYRHHGFLTGPGQPKFRLTEAQGSTKCRRSDPILAVGPIENFSPVRAH